MAPSVTYHDRVLYALHQHIVENAETPFDYESIKSRVKNLDIPLGPRSDRYIRRALAKEAQHGRIRGVGGSHRSYTATEAVLFEVVVNSTEFYKRASSRLSEQYGLPMVMPVERPTLTIVIPNLAEVPAQLNAAGANGTAPTLSPSEQDVSEGRVPLSSDNDDSEEPGVALPRFLHSDEEETETTTSVQDTLWQATLDVIGEYVRQSEESPDKVLDALKRAEDTLTKGVYAEFSLKILRALRLSIKRKELLRQLIVGLKAFLGFWSNRLTNVEAKLSAMESGRASSST